MTGHKNVEPNNNMNYSAHVDPVQKIVTVPKSTNSSVQSMIMMMTEQWYTPITQKMHTTNKVMDTELQTPPDHRIFDSGMTGHFLLPNEPMIL